MTPTVISVDKLGKEYVIGGRENGNDSFREMLVSAAAAPFRRLRRLSGDVAAEERIWALKDVSFEVKQGEVLGIIGRNGAGKSTLLKILSRITAPTEGRVEIRGRVSSLLEVGTGFHPELTGRENIYLNGAILGMSRAEINRKFDAIVDFSGVEKFLDTPVKRYSSGMAVRLAFSIAAHLEPEILIVDEVLAVGDAEFQRKCLGKMREVSGAGRTVLFVSHNMAAVRQLCDRGIVIESGNIVGDSRIDKAVLFYSAAQDKAIYLASIDKNSAASLLKINIYSQSESKNRYFAHDEPLFVEITAAYRVEMRGYFTVRIQNHLSQDIIFSRDVECNENLADRRRGSETIVARVPPLALAPGLYNLLVSVNTLAPQKLLDSSRNPIPFEVFDNNSTRSRMQIGPWRGVTAIPIEWERRDQAMPKE